MNIPEARGEAEYCLRRAQDVLEDAKAEGRCINITSTERSEISSLKREADGWLRGIEVAQFNSRGATVCEQVIKCEPIEPLGCVAPKLHRSSLSLLRDPREDDAYLLKKIEARRQNCVAKIHG